MKLIDRIINILYYGLWAAVIYFGAHILIALYGGTA